MKYPRLFAQNKFTALALAAIGAVAGSNALAASYTYRIPMGGLTGAAPSGLAGPQLAFRDNVSNVVLATVTFPDTAAGSSSAPVVVKVVNTGTADLTFNATPFTVTAPYSLSATTCSGTLAPAASCTATLVFSPTAGGSFSGAYMTASSNATGTAVPNFAGNGTVSGVTNVMALDTDTLVRMGDGSWKAAGGNGDGQFGLGDFTDSATFITLPGLAGATEVHVGYSHIFAKFADGTWKGAGGNYSGQLGLGATQYVTTFTPIPALTGVTRLVTGAFTTFAQKSDGTWMGTGYNYYYQLGIAGDSTNRTVFTDLPSLTGATDVVAADYHTLKRLSDGSWQGIGYNYDGQLGTNDTSMRLTWTAMPAISGATAVYAGASNTFAKLASGNWVASGDNGDGQLGVGDRTVRRVFTAVPSLAGALYVVPVSYHTVALMSDGTVKGSGWNATGQLGTNSATRNITSFTTMPAISNVTKVTTGQYHTVALRSDNTVMVTGLSSDGQMGLGDYNEYDGFVPVTP